MRLPRAELVLPILIVLSATALAISEFLIAFEFTPPGGEVQGEQTGGDRHGYAMLVLGIGAVVAMGVAITSGSRPAAMATAGIGVIALLLFLILDLPDAGKVGPLEDFITARADAQPGFWLTAISAVGLAIGGGILATLTPTQLRAPMRLLGFDDSSDSEDPPAPPASAASGTEGGVYDGRGPETARPRRAARR